ncbi:hypothetical protein ILYODFUR_006013 [Ilyodon furcidens]|uniref:Secreted protein n=1 Tax=Ilyodon furcidens TaxID=33524 RepID=A0ABV0V0M8_9TELE
MCFGRKIINQWDLLIIVVLSSVRNTLPGQKESRHLKKRSHTIFGEPPLALITAHVLCGIVSVSFCNVTRFISTQCCINFTDLAVIMVESDRCEKPSPAHPKDSQGLDSVVANPCVRMTSHAP